MDHSAACKTPGERGKEALSKAGYAVGGKITMPRVKRVVRRGIAEHETEEHGGRHGKITLKAGGSVRGEKAKERPDRQRRADGGGIEGRAMGGEMPHRSGGGRGGKAKVGTVNIKIGGKGEGAGGQPDPAAMQAAQHQGIQQGMRMGAALGARQAGAGMQRPPMGGPPPGAGGLPAGGPPGGMPPGGPPPPGGGGMPVRDGGEIHVREHQRRRAGGSVGASA